MKSIELGIKERPNRKKRINKKGERRFLFSLFWFLRVSGSFGYLISKKLERISDPTHGRDDDEPCVESVVVVWNYKALEPTTYLIHLLTASALP